MWIWSLERAVIAGATEAGIEGVSSCEGGSDSSGRWPRVDEESQDRSFQRPRDLKCAKRLVESNYGLGRESSKASMDWATCGFLVTLTWTYTRWPDALRSGEEGLQCHSRIKDPSSLGLSLCSNSCLPRSTGISVGDKKKFCNIKLLILLLNLHIYVDLRITCFKPHTILDIKC